MTACDDWILEALQSSGMALSLRVLAHNIEYNRQYVQTRLSVLEQHGLVAREARGMYSLTDLAERYLQGEIEAERLEDD